MTPSKPFRLTSPSLVFPKSFRRSERSKAVDQLPQIGRLEESPANQFYANTVGILRTRRTILSAVRIRLIKAAGIAMKTSVAAILNVSRRKSSDDKI
jgi:hypothetical protein